MKRLLALAAAGALVGTLLFAQAAEASGSGAPLSSQAHPEGAQHFCNTNGLLCTEPFQNWEEFSWFKKADARAPMGEYIGHDEPSVLFYSHKDGSGNSNNYLLKLPTDPPVLPQNDGSGGTDNFQLHPAFWFGMAMCDNQSAPNPGHLSSGAHATVPCKRDSDSNIYESSDPSSPHYMGLHPGTAFMEMQFYPPGWVPWPPGISCTAHEWCAALNVDSLSENMNTGQINNTDCLNNAGIEPVNFAFLTKDGHSTAPANPLSPDRFTPTPADLLMGSGDQLRVHMFDTDKGFKVVIDDLTTGTSGGMTASRANGFGKVRFQPNAASCSVHLSPFHPEYNTSSPRTRVPWAAHSYNVAYSDEIGHFENCGKVNLTDLSCSQPLGNDTNDGDQDDSYCLPGALSTLVDINGCLTTDGDFDGSSYGHNWPGSISDPVSDQRLNPSPIQFSSPRFRDAKNYGRVAFEADLPRIEDADTSFGVPACQRHISNPADPSPGANCVNPPPNSQFYPFYSTTTSNGTCVWQEGGKYQPATNRFGGEKAEYGPLLATTYASTGWTTSSRYNNFRRILDHNPCPRSGA
ncbi:MAG: hypothetical protein QOH48_689 [Actinomycetota bacterium]|nr:hypothetical protein [Actinomycetota bacterium]